MQQLSWCKVLVFLWLRPCFITGGDLPFLRHFSALPPQPFIDLCRLMMMLAFTTRFFHLLLVSHTSTKRESDASLPFCYYLWNLAANMVFSTVSGNQARLTETRKNEAVLVRLFVQKIRLS
jgi:hypothetical protein